MFHIYLVTPLDILESINFSWNCFKSFLKPTWIQKVQLLWFLYFQEMWKTSDIFLTLKTTESWLISLDPSLVLSHPPVWVTETEHHGGLSNLSSCDCWKAVKQGQPKHIAGQQMHSDQRKRLGSVKLLGFTVKLLFPVQILNRIFRCVHQGGEQ